MNQRALLKDGGVIDYDDSFLDTKKANELFSFLKDNIQWEQKYYNFSGKKVAQPRLTAWYADSLDIKYYYSGLNQVARLWLPELIEIKKLVEIAAQTTFNSVLLNYYRNGKDSVALHADDEKELGKDPVIASLSVGAARLFTLVNKSESMDYILTNGSLLIMSGTLQTFWEHTIPKDLFCKTGRINLTFRKIYK